MLSAGELAGLLVAVFWAILVCFMAVVLVRLARLLTETTKSVAELSDRLAPLLDDMSETVGEANRRLAAVEAVTDNVREVSGNMVRITGIVSALFAGPVIKIASIGHGLRQAIARRERRGPARRVADGRRGTRPPAPRIPDRRAADRGVGRAAERRAIGRGH
ncbi:DUF948 domain-containing protein [Microbispora sp. NPDC049125]|uniref:DUF948 domain-containing protein n=1 Tax=Microbispora sp. NPDC049125 TaxID=3154929 RepID=UPI0034678898